MSFSSNNNSIKNSYFSSEKNKANINKKSSDELFEIIRSLDIIDIEKLTQQDTTDILKRIDDYKGFFSTQQLTNINYANFKEHVFFDSAVSKVSYAIDRIQNIPYDQPEIENLKYYNKTDGYTYYLLKNIYPKNIGHIKFSGNEKLVAYDQQGKILNDSDTRKIGTLNPLNKRFSFDFWIKVDRERFLDNQIVFKKFDHVLNNGFICYLSDISGDLKTCNINFCVIIQNKIFHAKTEIVIAIEKNSQLENIFQNIVINFDNSLRSKKTNFYVNGNIVNDSNIVYSNDSEQTTEFKETFSKNNLPFVIGGIFLINQDETVTNSLSLTIDGEEVVFTNFFGAIDEFRFFHKIRSSKKVKLEKIKNIYSQRDLALYFRFNEPAGEYTNCCLAIDYSGNKLHGIIYRQSPDDGNNTIISDSTNIFESYSPIIHEKAIDSPVLNGSYTQTIDIRKNLIQKAKEYDLSNPSLIFNLLPKHYFLEASEFQNLPVYSNEEKKLSIESISEEDGSLKEVINSTLNVSAPANNDMVNIVLIWARFFDQLKAYISSITNFLNVDYDSINNEKIIGMQIPILCKMYGIKFSEILPSPTKSKLNNLNLTFEDLTTELSIRKIQNILWSRFLINTQDFLRSKGTIRSIETAFRSFGIDHTKLIDVKERSSHNDLTKINKFNLKNNLFEKLYVNFGSKLDLSIDPTYEDQLVSSYTENKLLFKISNLKSQISDNRSIVFNNGMYKVKPEYIVDGLTVDWSIEMFFSFNESLEKLISLNTNFNKFYKRKQCLFRLETDGYPTLAVFFEKTKSDYSSIGNVNIYIQPVKNNDNFNVEMSITNVNIFEFPQYFCLSQRSNLENNSIIYSASLSDIGDIVSSKNIKSVEIETNPIVSTDFEGNITKNLRQFLNIDNSEELSNNISFYNNNVNFVIGSYNYKQDANGLSLLFDDINDTTFEGKIYNFKIWNESLTDREKLSHSLSLENKGIRNKLNILNNIVFDLSIEEDYTATLQDELIIYNFNDNNLLKKEADATPLNVCQLITKNSSYDINDLIDLDTIKCKYLDAKIDEPFKENNFDILSFEEESNKLKNNSNEEYPLHRLPKDYKDTVIEKVCVEMSICKTINDDISKLIVDLNKFTNLISNSLNPYEVSYKELEVMRKDYFSKYSDKNLINYASVGNVFKYFDNIMSSILFDIIPSNTRFDGFNYVYESHILERHKYHYKNKDSLFSIIGNNFIDYSRSISNERRSVAYNTSRQIIKRD